MASYPREVGLLGTNESYVADPLPLDALGTLWEAPLPTEEVPRPVVPGLLLAAALLLLLDTAVRRWAEARATSAPS